MDAGLFEEDEDCVIRELDVYLCNDVELYLLQFPLKPCYIDTPEIYTARFKPKAKLLEMGGDESIPKVSSTTVNTRANLGVGVIRGDSMHITPLKQILQMRPSLDNIQTRGGEVVTAMPESDEDDEEDGNKADQPSLEQVQMKRKETDRIQSARLQSYAYLKDQVDREPWQHLQVNAMGSEASDMLFDRMYYTET